MMHGSSIMEVDFLLSLDRNCSYKTFSEQEHLEGNIFLWFKASGCDFNDQNLILF